jgi:hypothetical protein
MIDGSKVGLLVEASDGRTTRTTLGGFYLTSLLIIPFRRHVDCRLSYYPTKHSISILTSDALHLLSERQEKVLQHWRGREEAYSKKM